MQTVSSELLTALQSGNTTAKKFATVVEFYKQDATPTASGFDPSSSDLLFAVAKVKGITFKGVSYTQLITANGIGKIPRTIGKRVNSFQVTLSNSNRDLLTFENTYGFEGKICVVRLLHRTASTDLDDTVVLFTGRCEKIQSFSKTNESATIKVTQILNQTEKEVPRRKFTVDDINGRSPSDVLFEGFRFIQRNGAVTFIEKVKTKFLFFWTKTKKVQRTLQFSSHSDTDQEKVVPLVLGRVQAELNNFAYEDRGTAIDVLAVACDGYENGIKSFEAVRSVTEGFPITVLATRLGEAGNTGSQVIRDANFVGAGYYSKTAYLETSATGSLVEQDDPAPQIVAIIYGLKVPTYDDLGDFVLTDFSDNGVILSRWALTSDYVFGLNSAWIDDSKALDSAIYCNQILFDQTNSDTVLYNVNQTGIAGTSYNNYSGTGVTNPALYKQFSYDSGLGITPYQTEADYQFYGATPYNSDDPEGTGTVALPPTVYRRRYTTNVMLSEQMPAIDFLYDILLPSFNGYITQTASGKLAIKVAKPVEHSFVYTANTAGVATLKVQSIQAWIGAAGQRVLVGANLPTSEVKKVVSVAYDTSIAKTITASGCTASTSTLTGGSSSVAPFSTVTVSSASGTKTLTIDGYVLTYAPQTGDTTYTIAGMLASMVNAHPVLTRYIGAVWVGGESTLKVFQKIGTITVDSNFANVHNAPITDPTTAPTLSAVGSGSSLAAGTYKVAYSWETLEGETLVSSAGSVTITAGQNIRVAAITPLPTRAVNARWYISPEPNSVRLRYLSTNTGATFDISAIPSLYEAVEPAFNATGAELHNIALAFADKATTRAGLTSSNMLSGSFQFPLGNRQPSTNEIKIKYRDASQDFKNSELRVRDTNNIAKVKKVNTKEINGAAVDSYHQARRLANQKLAEWRDGDFFHALSADNEALLLEEGDVICVTDESGAFVNEPVRVEDLEFDDADGYPVVSITARKYRRYYYDDQIQEKIVPLPLVINDPVNNEQEAPVISIATAATNTFVSLNVTNVSQNALFRKIEFSPNSGMSSATVTVVAASANGGVLPNPQGFIKVSEASATTYYFRVSHSSAGITYGAVSNILTVVFADSGGSGGSGGTGDAPLISGFFNNIAAEVELTIELAAGGTGNYQIEKSNDGSSWTTVTSSWAGSSSYSVPVTRRSYDYDMYFRVKRANDSSAYSDALLVTITAF